VDFFHRSGSVFDLEQSLLSRQLSADLYNCISVRGVSYLNLHSLAKYLILQYNCLPLKFSLLYYTSGSSGMCGRE
jgi:hypothetical protein